jgi:hypothetical protein
MGVERDSSIDFADAISVVARRASIPYAYTLSIWGSTSALETKAGRPDLVDVVLLVAGAAVAFAAVAVLALRVRPIKAVPQPPTLLRTGLFQALALACAIGASLVAAFVPEPAGWAVVGAVATLVFLLVSALDVRFAAA